MYRLVFLLVFCGLLSAGRLPDWRSNDGNQDPDVNVNTRYTVESIDFKGSAAKRLSERLQSQLNRLVGEKLDPGRLGKYAEMIQKELRAKVAVRVEKGTQQGNVAVAFDIDRPTKVGVDLSATGLTYHSSEGWTGSGIATITKDDHAFKFGLVSDGDQLTERFTGIRAGYENKFLISDRVGFRFDYSNYRAQWNSVTLNALAASNQLSGPEGIYRTRESFAPVVTFALAKPLSLSVGVDFVQLQSQYPSANSESANAAISTLRYSQRWGDPDQGTKHAKDNDDQSADLTATYAIRTAARTLDSDLVYTRHSFGSRFAWTRGANKVIARFTGGIVNGAAPLFERFSAGNTQTLRGWNKFDLAPKGGDRIATGTIEYRYDMFMCFYDTGAVWDRGTSPSQKHGVGVGLHFAGFQVAVALPVRDGHMTPVFLVGTTF